VDAGHHYPPRFHSFLQYTRLEPRSIRLPNDGSTIIYKHSAQGGDTSTALTSSTNCLKILSDSSSVFELITSLARFCKSFLSPFENTGFTFFLLAGAANDGLGLLFSGTFFFVGVTGGVDLPASSALSSSSDSSFWFLSLLLGI